MHVTRGAGNERTWWGRDLESPSLNATFVVTLVIVGYRIRERGRSGVVVYGVTMFAEA
jgi:hypothetical protein